MSLMSTVKGMLGEGVINLATWLALDKTIYQRINNVTLPLANGGSTQIDHIIVSPYGIFVIETKNYKGWIFGSEHQRQWTQTIMGKKYKFQNPLHQNYLHIKALSDVLALEPQYFHSVIAFIGEAKIKTRDALPAHVLDSGIISYIKQKQDVLLTPDEVHAIVEQIHSQRFSKSWRTNQQHKTYLKEKHAEPNKPANQSQVEEKDSAREVVKERPKVHVYERWSGQTEVETPAQETPANQNTVIKEVLSQETLKEETVNEDKPSQEKLSAPICPKCQGAMVKRVAKTGTRAGQAFYGCTSFPKCRGMVNL
ncbi:NERD domain-containing protein [Psychrobacter aestuarii]|uniref:NERD domain-containing protein n=1 Tax=Psychrobacter aestuarii TaxID=556327 RepID=A0ABN0VN36_9GAMM|nr:NERD domain-containing protein [Psychrobacter aestuarii]